ncbi:glycosyltransferase [Jannaschia sp. S6380]|uniref:glycosyltransferase n=1 Tax=Jannaschia sp. S6380 TaxID=2926408 RepID=UPI001FF62C9C|nr:glycosyltransferase [Jannaschia sp. S6380]MCK0168419.1 glycosyltransferase [Jannaschia sp. S6380]
MTVDLSVILTAHDETLVAGPTLRAVEDAVAVARAAGLTVETILVLDAATPDTADYFAELPLEGWDRLTLTAGDLGAARNAAAARAAGRNLAFVDADDLVSWNWFVEGVRLLNAAARDGRHVIAHPEVNWIFDGAADVVWNPAQDDPLWTPRYFYAMNYYDSMCMAPRAAHAAIPYAGRDIPAGLSFQDWQFSVETTAAGWFHATARDTVIFKRRRPRSLVTESQGRRALVRDLPALRIDRVADLGRIAGPRGGPPAPSLAGDTPHDGSALDERVRQAADADPTPERDAPQYAALRAAMDLHHYLAVNEDLFRARRLDPVAHFIRRGLAEDRRPARYFGPRRYVGRHPEAGRDPEGPLAHWLRHGRRAGHVTVPFARFEEVADLIGLAPRKVQDLLEARHAEVLSRLRHGTLGAMVADAARIEPLIAQVWPRIFALKIPPFHSDLVVSRVAAVAHAQAQAAHRTARFVVTLDADAAALAQDVIAALARIAGPEEVVVMGDGAAPPGLPVGVRHVDLHAAAAGLPEPERERALIHVIRSLGPAALLVAGPDLAWRALQPYGRALAASVPIIGCLPRNGIDMFGHPSGPALGEVYRHFDILSAVVTIDAAEATLIAERHMMPADLRARLCPLDPDAEAVLRGLLARLPG